MCKYSIVIPVFNRPQEIDELLDSLTRQDYKEFEVIVVEDGSTLPCRQVIKKYDGQLVMRYVEKEHSGQGFSRNEGFKKARGKYFIVFDSDCIIPADYLSIVDRHLSENYLDAYGGPDRAHEDFTLLQKAISISMTSVFTTGGIRGRKNHAGTFHPRSFNLGISREVFEATGGYRITRMGEDIELSIRIINEGFTTGLISEAFVYHKRRTSLMHFFKQLHFFGRARINVGRFHPGEVRFVHILPLLFVAGILATVLAYFISHVIFQIGLLFYGLFVLLVFLNAFIESGDLLVSLLTIVASFVQLSAYGIGFFTEWVRKFRDH